MPGGPTLDPSRAGRGRHDVNLCRLEPVHHHIAPVRHGVIWDN